MRLDPEQAGHDCRSLASALQDLRRASGLSGERPAQHCHMSKVSRTEDGRLLPSTADVDRIPRALEVEQATSNEPFALARVANTEYQGIRASVRSGLHHRQRELAALEASTKGMRHFLPTLIADLLQAPEYTRAAMNTPVKPAARGTTTAIALKLERQVILHDKSKHFELLLTESVLRWQLCEPSVMIARSQRSVKTSCEALSQIVMAATLPAWSRVATLRDSKPASPCPAWLEMEEPAWLAGPPCRSRSTQQPRRRRGCTTSG